ncbi:metal dependent phosphohydrolase [Candidatus Scalindua japonica]|uniref:5'-deoxynucleotidase n=1 Tax=Candidatus Scalindua japonica TaxID=1284222 RepID=A0A286TUF2_9BACT|nr:HD domain-containing protein [Candidatus Scalindua japonica]GAX59522.1 metal dependent phosphohydrolase [Candidatus Scalindua japonica]
MQEIVNFLFEVGFLKNVERSGWRLFGNKAPESVAEHSFRCTILGYILAKLERVDASKVIMMCLFHDVHEARTNDLHKIAQRYINLEEGGEKATQEQLGSLKGAIGDEIGDVLSELTNQKSRESIVARDADILECAMQAREYQVQGFDAAVDWLDRADDRLRCESSKKLLSILIQSDPNEWWKRLKDKK